MIQQTSLVAYTELEGELGDRQLQVLRGFRKLHEATNLELSVHLSLPINQVTPRTNELVKAGCLESKDKRPCRISGKMAIVWGEKK